MILCPSGRSLRCGPRHAGLAMALATLFATASFAGALPRGPVLPSPRALASAPHAARATPPARRSAPYAASESLLGRLPRPAPSAWRAALRHAQARGPAGAADAAWIGIFYGDAAARAHAGQALALAARREPRNATVAFEQFVLEWMDGHQQREMRAALKLLRLAPNDPAAELAARQISGVLPAQGRLALDAAPEMRRLFSVRLADPVTAYMLGGPLLSLVGAPGLKLARQQAAALAGRPDHWTLFGPFGEWRNLDFGHAFPIENSVATQYPDGAPAGPAAQPRPGRRQSPVRMGLPFTPIQGIITFPSAWNNQGVSYAETFLHVPRTAVYLLRAYSPASWRVQINGRTVLTADRRACYCPAAAAAALRLHAGWNRVLVQVGGTGDRTLSLMLRPLAGGAAPASVGQLPAAARLAPPPVLLPPPPTLAAWAQSRLHRHPHDAVALWASGIRLMQDDDAEGARAPLEAAAKLVPNATPVWLALTDDTLALSDASESWATAHAAESAQKAETTDPEALPAYDRLGDILQSEGKPNAAAAAYAHCSGRGYARCDWSAFQLDLQRHWLPEARRALAHALVETPSGWHHLTQGLEFYNQMGDALRAQRLAAQLARDPRAAPALGEFWLQHGRPAEAAKWLAQAVTAEPSSSGLRERYLHALLASSDSAAGQSAAEAAATQALAAFPYSASVARAAADITLAADPAHGLAQLRAFSPGHPAIRRAADFLAGNKFWLPWYRDAQQVIKGAPGKAQYPNAHSILVFDQMVDRINPDNSRTSYIHQVFRVLDSVGISAEETVNIPPGSDLITLRTIKQDGTILLPEIRPGAHSVTMPGLAPGDYIESAYIMHTPASQVVPGALDNNMFFVFNSSKQPYHFSEYVVLTRKGDPLMINTERFPHPPKVTGIGDWVAHQWLIQHTRILGVEPDMPPEQQLVPRVWVSSQLTWHQISQSYADAAFSVRRATPAMQATARQLAAAAGPGPIRQAQSIFNWVAANIHPARGPALAPARQAFVDRSGNRLSVFLGLLSAAHVPWQLVLARPVTDHSTLAIPNIFSFQYPLVRVPDAAASASGKEEPAAARPASQAAWFDLNGAFARLGYINPAFRGGQALLAGAPPGQAFVSVPSAASPLDDLATEADIHVQPDGDAALTLTLRFRGPLGQDIRHTLQSLPAAQLPQIYQQVLLRNYPNATSSGGKILGLDARDHALSIVVNAAIPGFVQINGGQWELDRLAGPVGVLARYAQLPSRVHPLVIPSASRETTRVMVTLPANLTAPATPGDLNLTSPFGSFQAIYQVQGSRLTLQRSISLGADYILPSQYPAFRHFGQAVDSQDHLPITGTVRASAAKP